MPLSECLNDEDEEDDDRDDDGTASTSGGVSAAIAVASAKNSDVVRREIEKKWCPENLILNFKSLLPNWKYNEKVSYTLEQFFIRNSRAIVFFILHKYIFFFFI